MEYKKNYTLRLFAAIVIMIVPLFLSFHIIKGLSYSALTICCFGCSIIICNSIFVKDGHVQIRKDFSIILAFFIFFQFLGIINGYLNDGVLLQDDLFNVIGKTIMVYTFIVLPSYHVISDSDFNTFTKYFTILSFLVCLFNLIDNYSIIANFLSISNSYQFNVTGVFANRNQLGSFMFISIVAHIYRNVRNTISKIDIIVYIFQIITLVLSMSRGAMLATGVCLIIYFGVFNQYIIKHPFLSSIIFVLIGLSFFNDTMWQFIQKNLIRSEVGNSGRSDVWQYGFNVVNINLKTTIVGQGYYHGVSIAQSQGMQVNQFHSFYVDTLVSGGIVELFYLIMMFIYVAKKGLKCCNKKLKQVYVSSFIGYLTLCFFESDSVLSIGYVDMINTVFFVAIPILLGGMNNNFEKFDDIIPKQVGESY